MTNIIGLHECSGTPTSFATGQAEHLASMFSATAASFVMNYCWIYVASGGTSTDKLKFGLWSAAEALLYSSEELLPESQLSPGWNLFGPFASPYTLAATTVYRLGFKPAYDGYTNWNMRDKGDSAGGGDMQLRPTDAFATTWCSGSCFPDRNDLMWFFGTERKTFTICDFQSSLG